MDMKKIGNRIKTTRCNKGMVLKDVADQIGVAISTIQRYEAGTIEKPKMPVIQAIARVLDVDPSWLIGKADSAGQYSSTPCTEFLGDKDKALLDAFRSLNEEGQDQLLDFADSLLKSGKFSKKDSKAKVV